MTARRDFFTETSKLPLHEILVNNLELINKEKTDDKAAMKLLDKIRATSIGRASINAAIEKVSSIIEKAKGTNLHVSNYYPLLNQLQAAVNRHCMEEKLAIAETPTGQIKPVA